MERTLIGTLGSAVTTRVRICGWVNKIRNQKRMQFLVLRDPSGLIQVTHARTEGGSAIETAFDNLAPESAVEVVGTVVANEGVKLGGIELVPESITVHNLAAPLPIAADSDLEVRMDYRYLDLRRPERLLIFRVQTAVEEAMRQFWTEEGFIEIHSPKLLGSASESGSELFVVENYFKLGRACLAQSPQFYKQMAMAAGFERVFEIGPVFRANPSFTSRHDTEFTSVDMEVSWIESHKDVMKLEERWLAFVLRQINKRYGKEIFHTFGVPVMVPAVPFPRVTMAEAYNLIEQAGHRVEREKGDLDPEGERTLHEVIKRETGHEFVFVTDYPTTARPFYHMRPDHDSRLTKSFDLLWKGLEVTTGAQREHRYDRLVAQATEKGIPLETIQNYLDSFKFGMPPHGGFGLGLTRVLMVLLGINNVREVTYLYRGPNRLTP